MAVYLHSVPGRLRIKSPVLKGNSGKRELVENLFQGFDGVKSIKSNPLTGSLAINYCPELIDAALILDMLENKGGIDLSKTISNDEYLHNAFSKAGGFVCKILFGSAMDMALGDSALSFLSVLV
ncbi:HMA2 domain-containing protein [Candidatus Magnetominusculus dajiuhuensis]|uniref:HMA2 domain-containing protein n=1 Tax=Candidatus Magnetominusculus dajiuhuensis TaxID=3137712 RepID=UPI003B43225A